MVGFARGGQPEEVFGLLVSPIAITRTARRKERVFREVVFKIVRIFQTKLDRCAAFERRLHDAVDLPSVGEVHLVEARAVQRRPPTRAPDARGV